MNTQEEAFCSKNYQDHTSALKLLLSLLSIGDDISHFAPLVVQQVASPNPAARHLAYISLSYYSEEAHETICRAIIDVINEVIGDPSPYVKKAAAYAMVKAAELSED